MSTKKEERKRLEKKALENERRLGELDLKNVFDCTEQELKYKMAYDLQRSRRSLKNIDNILTVFLILTLIGVGISILASVFGN